MSSGNWSEYLTEGHKYGGKGFDLLDLMFPDDGSYVAAFLPRKLEEEINGVRFTESTQEVAIPVRAAGPVVEKPRRGAQTVQFSKKKTG